MAKKSTIKVKHEKELAEMHAANKAKIVYRKVDDLIPYAMNSRTHSEDQVSQIAASIKEFGFTNPVLIKDNTIISGHGRVMAAKKLEMDKVPTISLDGLTDTQVKAYVIADNKLALNAGWDFDILKVEIEQLEEHGFNVQLLGFDNNELNNLYGESKEITGAKEINEDQFSDFDHKCPKCGFEFDNEE